MLKKRILIILIFVLSFSYFLNVSYASNHSIVYLTSDKKEVNQGEEIEITVNLKNSKISACNFSIYFEESKVEFAPDLNKQDIIESTHLIGNKLNFVWFDKLGGEEAKEGEIVSFKFKSKEKGLATFTIEGQFYNKNGQLIETEFKEVQIQIGKEENNLPKQVQEEQGTNSENSNSNLKVLRLDKEGIVPNFEKDIQEYYLTIPQDTQNIDVLVVTENPDASTEIKGNTNLQEGINDITIKVTSPDKTQSKVYTIHVSKTNNFESTNTNLETLSIQNVLLNPPFDNSYTNYEIEVPHIMESLNILAIPENEKATVKITGGDNLKEGSNLIKILITAPDGFTKKTYNIKANRRTLEQEAKYEEELEKQKEELENAYKIEKTSMPINDTDRQLTEVQNKDNKSIIIWIIAILSIVLVVFGAAWIVIKKHRNRIRK